MNYGTDGRARDISQGTYYLPVILHKDLSTGDLLKRTDYNAYSASPEHTVGINTEVISADYNNIVNVQEYNYVGISKGSSDTDKDKPDSGAIEITTDENNLYVTFWYQKGPATATVNYQVVGESTPRYTESVEIPESGINISRFDLYKGQNHNQSLIGESCVYKGLVKEDKSGKYPSSGFAKEDSVNATDRGTVVTFWYQKTEVKIIHKTEKNILETEYYTLMKDETETYYPKDPASFGSGYKYRGYEITEPVPQAYKDATITEGVPVKFDGEYHEIIFYYIPHVTIKVVGVSVREVEKNKFDYKAIPGVEKTETKEITGKEEKYTYSHFDLEGYEYLKKYSIIPGTNSYTGQVPTTNDKGNGATVTVVEESDKKPTTMILIAFYYDTDLLKIYHIDEETNKSLINPSPRVVDLINQPVTEYSITSQLENYVNSKVTLTETKTLEKNSKAEEEINPEGFRRYGKNRYSVTVTPDGNDYTLKFYYLKYNITVKHHLLEFDLNGNSEIVETQDGTYDISEDGKISANSITGTNNYLNWNVSIKDKNGKVVTPSYMIGNNKVDKPSEYGAEQYKVIFDAENNQYTIDFYYVKQQLEVKHVWEDGDNDDSNDELIIDPEITYLPTTESPLDKDKNGKEYNCVSYVLNDTKVEGTISSVTVQPDPIYGAKQILIFKYTRKPIIIPGDTFAGTRIEPNNINNQSVDASKTENLNKKYWVLDNANHKLTVTIETESFGGTAVTTCAATIKIPFDVYIDNVLKSAGTPLEVTMTSTSKGEINNIFVPIWTEEQEHKITADLTVNYKYEVYNESSNKVEYNNDSVAGGAEASVTVVGRVYDFSVINLKADEKWQAALFRDKEAHLSDTLPLGQNNIYQPEKYTTGILKGAPIYFSLNTKGSDNERVIIKPSFYYAEKGTTGSSPETVRNITLKDSKGNVLDTKSIVLSKDDINTFLTGKTEFDNDRKDAKTYGLSDNLTQNINLGNSSSLTLNTNVKLPYAGYLSEFTKTLPTGKENKNLLEEASQWYGCYTIPNDAVAYKDGQKLENGFIIVYFEIITQRKNASGQWIDYLSYSLPSPILTTGESEWKRERAASTDVYLLPRKSKTQNDKMNVADWYIDDHAAIVIYEIAASTKDNYTSVGTH